MVSGIHPHKKFASHSPSIAGDSSFLSGKRTSLSRSSQAIGSGYPSCKKVEWVDYSQARKTGFNGV